MSSTLKKSEIVERQTMTPLKMNPRMAAIIVALAASATPLFAQIGHINVDENGNMTINGNPGPPGVIGIEPISGLQALCYQLPGYAGNAGDIVLVSGFEPTNAPNEISDLIRFPGNGNMYFFSLIDDTEPTHDLADVPAMPPLITPNLFINEIGPEGNNNADYTPGPGGIGGNSANPNI